MRRCAGLVAELIMLADGAWRTQGGLLVDGFAVLLSGAVGTAPSVSYCMNGFIAISRVASRGSGALSAFSDAVFSDATTRVQVVCGHDMLFAADSLHCTT